MPSPLSHLPYLTQQFLSVLHPQSAARYASDQAIRQALDSTLKDLNLLIPLKKDVTAFTRR